MPEENKKQRANKKKKKSKSAMKQQKMHVKKTVKEQENFSMPDHITARENPSKINVKDIHVPNFTMPRPGGGPELLSETDIQLTFKRRYGLIGKNGFGKTTLLRHIASGKIPEIPPNLRILHIKQEMPNTDKTVIDTVLASDEERNLLLAEEKFLLGKNGENTQNIENIENMKNTKNTKNNVFDEKIENKTENKTENDAENEVKNEAENKEDRLKKIYERLDQIDSDSAPARASLILNGLQFDDKMQKEKICDLSGGWRMRVSLACALFNEPDLLLLDEPTNHLDFPAVEWLSDYLNYYEKTLVVVSHDRKFLNDVCTDIIHIEDRQLKYYKGDYDTFERVRKEKRKQAKTAYDKQQATIEHNMDFIRRFRANKKLSSLAQSRVKILAGMEKLEDVKDDKKFRFHFPTPAKLKKAEVLLIDEMSFGYPSENSDFGENAPKNFLYKNVNLRMELGDVVGLFGKNGTGKSTLIQLAMRKLNPVEGKVVLNENATLGFFAQHHAEILDVEKTPYELLNEMFPSTPHQEIYRKLGQFRLAKTCANQKIKLLSGGEKSRLSFAILTWHEPHLLIMDEPTNHLDIETIDGLIEAIKEFKGSVLLISHDEHFLTKVCKEFWAIGPNKEIKAFHNFSKGKNFSYSKN